MPVTLSEMKARLAPERRAEVEHQTAEIKARLKGLQALRMARASTQVELADRLHVSQASVAKLERRTDVLLSTLRQYIEALGGHLDLVVRFDDGAEPLLITGLSKVDDPTEELSHTTHQGPRKPTSSRARGAQKESMPAQ
jgi:transcriptional regulator with XRE-family HTH domain